MESEPAKDVGQDMLRMRVRGCLESMRSEEGYSEPVARIRFVQLAIQAGARLNLQLWQHRTQTLQEAGEEGLRRFLDGEWKRGRDGKVRFYNSNVEWVLHLWEVACEEWNRERSKPEQQALEPPPELTLAERLRIAWSLEDWDRVKVIIIELEEAA